MNHSCLLFDFILDANRQLFQFEGSLGQPFLLNEISFAAAEKKKKEGSIIVFLGGQAEPVESPKNWCSHIFGTAQIQQVGERPI